MKSLLTIILTATLLTGCCWTDHSDTIREVAEPMLKELDAFYKKHKRHPNIEERDKMLKKVGCEMDGDECFYDGDKILVDRSRINNGDYTMLMSLENSSCYFYTNIIPSTSIVKCQKSDCIKIKQ